MCVYVYVYILDSGKYVTELAMKEPLLQWLENHMKETETGLFCGFSEDRNFPYPKSALCILWLSAEMMEGHWISRGQFQQFHKVKSLCLNKHHAMKTY